MMQSSPIERAEVSRPARRNLLACGLSAVLGMVAGAAARAQEAVSTRFLKTRGEVLKAEVSLGDPPVEPLDTMVHFRRSDNNNGRAVTHEILSLSHEEKGANSFPWTIYAHLGTHHTVGDACVVCARLHKYGPGWSSGLHSEVFNHNRAVSIGVNVEMGNDYTGTEQTQVIGVNVLAKGPRDADYGIHIHGDEGHFKTGIGLEGRGNVAIDIQGAYKVGLDMHGHDIRLGKGGSILLDEAGDIRIRYHNGAIEFLKRDKRFLHIPVEGEERKI